MPVPAVSQSNGHRDAHVESGLFPVLADLAPVSGAAITLLLQWIHSESQDAMTCRNGGREVCSGDCVLHRGKVREPLFRSSPVHPGL